MIEGCKSKAMNTPVNAPPRCASCPILSLCDLIPKTDIKMNKAANTQLFISNGKITKPILLSGKSRIEDMMMPLMAPDAPIAL